MCSIDSNDGCKCSWDIFWFICTSLRSGLAFEQFLFAILLIVAAVQVRTWIRVENRHMVSNMFDNQIVFGKKEGCSWLMSALRMSWVKFLLRSSFSKHFVTQTIGGPSHPTMDVTLPCHFWRLENLDLFAKLTKQKKVMN